MAALLVGAALSLATDPPACFAQSVVDGESSLDAASRPPAYRLRLFWGGGEPAAWQGQLSVQGGQLSDLRLLDANYDAPANAHLDANVINIHQRRAHRRGALDVTVSGSDDALLKLELRNPQTDQTTTVEIPLKEVVSTPLRRSLGVEGASLLLHRAAADRLRVSIEREDMLLAPGEALPLEIAAALPELAPGSPLDVGVELLPARRGQPLWASGGERLSVPVEAFATTRVTAPMPAEEGVYTVRITARQPPGSVKAWLPRSEGQLLAQREFQVVVLDPNRQQVVPGDWRTIQEIDPTSKRWWDRLPKWVWLRRAPWLPKGPLGSSPANIVALAAGDSASASKRPSRVVQLPPAEPSSSVWQAYPIPVTEPGKPYVVEVEYPADAQQQMVLTIMDQDRQGVAQPLGSSTGVAVSGWDSRRGGMRVVRRMFWPKSTSPLLVVSNHDSSRPVRYGRIRVLKASSETISRGASDPKRQLLAHIASPDLPRSVGATYGAQPEHEDWQTSYETARRLADWVALSGQDGAVVTVASAAGAIYPSKHFGDQPGADRELLVAGTLDLPRKDTLELLLREFDRRGMRLTPALRFESLLPSVEAQRSASTDRSASSAYSPLDADVQEAMVEEVRYLRERYGHHASFAGVAIEMTPGDYFTLPRASASPSIIKQFLAENRLQLPSAPPAIGDATGEASRRLGRAAAFARSIRGPWRDVWRIWSSGRIAELTGRMAQAAGADGQQRRLLILPSEALLTGAAAQTLRPRLNEEPNGAESLLALGLDLKQLEKMPGVDVILPRFLTGQQSLAHEATRLQANESFARLPGAAGTALVGANQIGQLKSLESANPFGGKRTTASLTIIAHSTALLAANAELAAGGAPGIVVSSTRGLPLVLDDPLFDLRQTLRQASPASTQSKSASRQPLEVRAVESGVGVVLQLANPSPWSVDANITIRTPSDCSVRELSPRNRSESQTEGVNYGKGEHVLQSSLAAYEVKLLAFDQPGVEPLGVRAQVSEAAISQLESRLTDLRNRNLSEPSLFAAGPNPSFEEVGFDGAVASWQALAGRTGGSVSLTTDAALQGERALRVVSRGGTVGVQSQMFPSPATGQLAMVFRIRGEGLSTDSKLRIVFEQPAGQYRNHTLVDAERILAADGQWRPYVFSVDDLPVVAAGDAAAGGMRIRFELIGKGQVDVDHLQLYDLVFPLDFLAGESAKQKLALLKTVHAAENAFQAGRLVDCQKMLDGYWPRFLQSYTPAVAVTDAPQPEAKLAARPQDEDKPDQEKPPQNESPPTLGERMRGYLPGFLRF